MRLSAGKGGDIGTVDETDVEIELGGLRQRLCADRAVAIQAPGQEGIDLRGLVTLEAQHLELAVPDGDALPCDQAEGAAADGRAVERGGGEAAVTGGDDRQQTGGEEMQQVLELRAQADAHGQGIDALDARYDGATAGHEIVDALQVFQLLKLVALTADDLVQGEDDIVGAQWRPVVKAQSRADVQGVEQMVGRDFPFLQYAGIDGAAVVGVGQGLEEDAQELQIAVRLGCVGHEPFGREGEEHADGVRGRCRRRGRNPRGFGSAGEDRQSRGQNAESAKSHCSVIYKIAGNGKSDPGGRRGEKHRFPQVRARRPVHSPAAGSRRRQATRRLQTGKAMVSAVRRAAQNQWGKPSCWAIWPVSDRVTVPASTTRRVKR